MIPHIHSPALPVAAKAPNERRGVRMSEVTKPIPHVVRRFLKDMRSSKEAFPICPSRMPIVVPSSYI
jgi:hypothetical protein